MGGSLPVCQLTKSGGKRSSCFQVHLKSSAYGTLRGETRKVDRGLNRQPPDRTAMKHRAGGRRAERKRQNDRRSTQKDEPNEEKMKHVRCNVAPIENTKSFWVVLQLGISALFLHDLGFRILSPGVMEARVNKIHTALFSAPQTQVCARARVCVYLSVQACMRGQGMVFAFLPGVATLSLPCLLSPEARPVCARKKPR